MIGIKKSDLITDFTSGSDKQAEKAALQLAATGLRSLETLKELLSDMDADIRWWATRTLAEIRAPESISLLLQALNDPIPAVQQSGGCLFSHQ